MFFGLLSFQQKLTDFTDSEIKLLKKIKFEKEVFIELKQYVNTTFIQYETSDPGFKIREEGEIQKTGIKKRKGISFKIPAEKADEIILKFKDKLNKSGYLMFFTDVGYEAPSIVTVIKSKDQFDILCLQKTDGINYGIENKDIIKKLKNWDKKFGIGILGTEHDFFNISIDVPKKDISDFAKEVYEFCPDAVDQGAGNIRELEKMILEYKSIELWWD